MLNILFILVALIFITAGVFVRFTDVVSFEKKIPSLKEVKDSNEYNHGTWLLFLSVFWIFVFFWALPYISTLIKIGLVEALREIYFDFYVLTGRNLGFLILCARIYFLISSIFAISMLANIEKVLNLKLGKIKFFALLLAIISLADPLIIKSILHLK